MLATGQERQPQSQSQPAMEPGSCPYQGPVVPVEKAVGKMYICYKKKREALSFHVSPNTAITLKAFFYKRLCSGCAYIGHSRTYIMEQIPSEGHSPVMPWVQPVCGECSNQRLWIWQVLLL